MVISNRVMAYCRCQEITWDQFCPLVYKLIKSMLSVCSGLTPDNRSCLITYFMTVPVNIFPVAFHVPLLEVSREPVHVLIIRQDSLGFSTKKIVMPDTYSGKCNRYIFFKR